MGLIYTTEIGVVILKAGGSRLEHIRGSSTLRNLSYPLNSWTTGLSLEYAEGMSYVGSIHMVCLNED